MENKVLVEVFYGNFEDGAQFGVSFYFDTYNEAKKFINKFIKEHSNCNARLIADYTFGD